jgi:FtsP/CotA-like multicopper oxidase with cupredoxin domain
MELSPVRRAQQGTPRRTTPGRAGPALSRRGFLAAGACTVAAGLTIGHLRVARGYQSSGGPELIEPAVRASQDGLLDTTLEARLAPVSVAGQTVTTTVYEGSLPGPTLRVRPGDRLKLRLINGLTEGTNLHVHGLHVSPAGNGDNPFL